MMAQSTSTSDASVQVISSPFTMASQLSVVVTVVVVVDVVEQPHWKHGSPVSARTCSQSPMTRVAKSHEYGKPGIGSKHEPGVVGAAVVHDSSTTEGLLQSPQPAELQARTETEKSVVPVDTLQIKTEGGVLPE